MSSRSTPPIRRGSSARSRSRPGRSTTVLLAARSSRCASGIDGRTIAYTGDTAWTDTLIDVADGTDLLIAEAYFWDKPVPYHLRHADLSSTARKSPGPERFSRICRQTCWPTPALPNSNSHTTASRSISNHVQSIFFRPPLRIHPNRPTHRPLSDRRPKVFRQL